MSLSLKQVTDVCLLGKGSSECRFLAEDNGVFLCLKLTSIRNATDREVQQYKSAQTMLGVDPNLLDKPIGDNCKGYTFFRHKMQGYDVI